MRWGVFFSFALLLSVCKIGKTQDVVSASSGLLHYFEGRIVLDNKPIEHKAAVFPSLKNGSVLRTEKGRAELLLTPDVYLRLDENTSLRMESNALTDTRLEMTTGSVILDNLNAPASKDVAVIHEGTTIRFPKPGIYRIDCEPGELQVFSGEAEVTHGKVLLPVDSTHLYYFALELTTNKYGDGAMDEFYDWAHNRSEIIADQNQMASIEQNDASDPDPSGVAGLLGPLSSVSPTYSGPSSSIFAYPSYGASPGYGSVISPLYLSPLARLQGFPAAPGILIYAPYRHRPVDRPAGTKWPVSTVVGYHPVPPVVTRWPVAGRTGSSIARPMPFSPIHAPLTPGYHPPSALPARPTVMSVPHTLPSVPHPAYSRPGPAVGHR